MLLRHNIQKIREKINHHHKKPHNLQLLLVKKTNELLASFNILTINHNNKFLTLTAIMLAQFCPIMIAKVKKRKFS